MAQPVDSTEIVFLLSDCAIKKSNPLNLCPLLIYQNSKRKNSDLQVLAFKKYDILLPGGKNGQQCRYQRSK